MTKNITFINIPGIAPLKLEENNSKMSFYDKNNNLLAENVKEYHFSVDSGLLVFFDDENRYFVYNNQAEFILEGEVFDKWENDIISFLKSDNLLESFLNLKKEAFECTPFVDDSLKILRYTIEEKLNNNETLSEYAKLKEENDAFNLIVNKIESSNPDLVNPAINYLNCGRDFNV